MTSAQQLILDIPVRPNYSKADFVTSSFNWEAVQWIQRWPDWPMKMVAIYGEPGCGKTHLAHIWQERSGARFLKLSDIATISPQEVVHNATAIILDDADTPYQNSSKEIPDEWFFHFYNLIQESGSDLLICSQQPPTQWPVKLPDLRSRLTTILSIAVSPPDEDALRRVFEKLCFEHGMILSSGITDYVLRRVERSFETIRTLVHALDHETLSQHRQLTLSLERDVLSDQN